MLVRCGACRGQKKIKGLGCMLKKCGECGGTGYKENPDGKLDDASVVECNECAQSKDVVEATAKSKSRKWVKKDA